MLWRLVLVKSIKWPAVEGDQTLHSPDLQTVWIFATSRIIVNMAPQYVLAAVLPALVAVVTAQDQPLLSTIATVPELSSFSAVILASGGSEPNPAFEERFNSVLDGRNYTALAPTNDVSSRGLCTIVYHTTSL